MLPLPLPGPEHVPGDATLIHNEAIALFCLRAQEVTPDFQLTLANITAVAELCRRLDGLPLAIELAAARIKLLPPQALLTRLQQHHSILTSTIPYLPARQHTLHQTIKWSYDLLDTDEQTLFRYLCVFVGGCTLEAAETLCQALGGHGRNVLEGVSSLLDKSLLQQREQDGERFLVAPYGVVQWVRNIRAAGTATLTRGRRSEAISVTELEARQAAPILKQCLFKAPAARPYFDATKDSPLEAFEREAAAHTALQPLQLRQVRQRRQRRQT